MNKLDYLVFNCTMRRIADRVQDQITACEAAEHTAHMNHVRRTLGVQVFNGTTSDMLRANTEVRRLIDGCAQTNSTLDLDDIVELARSIVRLPPHRMNLGFVLRNQGYVLVS